LSALYRDGGRTDICMDKREGGERKKNAHRILPHSYVLQSLLEHLEQLLGELDALAPVAGSDVPKDITNGRNRIRDRARDARGRVFAFLFARRVAVAGATTEIGSGRVGGFREDEVAQESVCVCCDIIMTIYFGVVWTQYS
jgi:hypothetical protein